MKITKNNIESPTPANDTIDYFVTQINELISSKFLAITKRLNQMSSKMTKNNHSID